MSKRYCKFKFIRILKFPKRANRNLTLHISAEEITGIIKFVKELEDCGVLLIGTTKSVIVEISEQNNKPWGDVNRKCKNKFTRKYFDS